MLSIDEIVLCYANSVYTIHGDYGVMVNTRVCGALDSGSIPDSRPKIYSHSQQFVHVNETQSADDYFFAFILLTLPKYMS